MSAPLPDLVDKFRRAVRNQQGTRLTFEDIQTFVSAGGMDALLEAELKHMRAKCAESGPSTKSGTTGWTSAPKVPSTRSAGMTPQLARRATDQLLASI